MDPNANLAEQDRLILLSDRHDRRRLAELRAALLEWMQKGGADPDWKQYPYATKAFRVWLKNIRKFQDLYR